MQRISASAAWLQPDLPLNCLGSNQHWSGHGASGVCTAAKSFGRYWYSISSVTPKLLCIRRLCTKPRMSSLWPVKLTVWLALLFHNNHWVLYYPQNKSKAYSILGVFQPKHYNCVSLILGGRQTSLGIAVKFLMHECFFWMFRSQHNGVLDWVKEKKIKHWTEQFIFFFLCITIISLQLSHIQQQEGEIRCWGIGFGWHMLATYSTNPQCCWYCEIFYSRVAACLYPRASSITTFISRCYCVGVYFVSGVEGKAFDPPEEDCCLFTNHKPSSKTVSHPGVKAASVLMNLIWSGASICPPTDTKIIFAISIIYLIAIAVIELHLQGMICLLASIAASWRPNV